MCTVQIAPAEFSQRGAPKCGHSHSCLSIVNCVAAGPHRTTAPAATAIARPAHGRLWPCLRVMPFGGSRAHAARAWADPSLHQAGWRGEHARLTRRPPAASAIWRPAHRRRTGWGAQLRMEGVVRARMACLRVASCGLGVRRGARAACSRRCTGEVRNCVRQMTEARPWMQNWVAFAGCSRVDARVGRACECVSDRTG